MDYHEDMKALRKDFSLCLGVLVVNLFIDKGKYDHREEADR